MANFLTLFKNPVEGLKPYNTGVAAVAWSRPTLYFTLVPEKRSNYARFNAENR
jgi:hypothetical protein